MPWTGAGSFSRIFSWQADKAAGLDISSVRLDTDTNDITANGLGNCLTRDGQGSPTRVHSTPRRTASKIQNQKRPPETLFQNLSRDTRDRELVAALLGFGAAALGRRRRKKMRY
jgi:MYXO-CTERM domain-containing protein